MSGVMLEPLDVLVRSAGKEKELVKIALSDCIGLGSWKAGVLYEFSGRKRGQWHHRDPSLLGNKLKRFLRVAAWPPE